MLHGQSSVGDPDADRDRFVLQARLEGMSLSAWLRAAAHTRLEERQHLKPFESLEDIKEFFKMCDALEGPEMDPTGMSTYVS
ncbi:MAG: hypothetical protein OXG36_09025, partial [Caldilineaceae bacterium]|nr:hypothetical protein [Caldilineaceae bacterium]